MPSSAPAAAQAVLCVMAESEFCWLLCNTCGWQGHPHGHAAGLPVTNGKSRLRCLGIKWHTAKKYNSCLHSIP